jgi:hypothetical protein
MARLVVDGAHRQRVPDGTASVQAGQELAEIADLAAEPLRALRPAFTVRPVAGGE